MPAPRTARRLAPLVVLPLVALLGACGGGDGGTAADRTAEPAPTGPREIDTPDCVPDDARAVVTGPEDEPVVVVTLGEGTNGLVFAPQSGDTYCEWVPTLEAYAAQGYTVTSFAWSGHPVASLESTVEVLLAEGVDAYALVGSSVGAAMSAALADDLDPAPAGVLALSPAAVSDAGSAASADSTYTGPLLVIGSAADNATAARRVARSDDPTTYLEVPGGAHGLAILATGSGPMVEERMSAFLDGVFAG
ncbi:alpha/beta hydrolase [Cellulomonas sp. NPDC055163]